MELAVSWHQIGPLLLESNDIKHQCSFTDYMSSCVHSIDQNSMVMVRARAATKLAC
eukprot:SAG31_NODE_140_length_22731_cov_10.941410_6_plen_56_part_00